jgi:membrane peptidoglycan carboxypeptidase
MRGGRQDVAADAVRRAMRSRVLRLLWAFGMISALAGILMTVFVMPLVASANWAVDTETAFFAALPSDPAQVTLPQRSVILAADGSPITYFYDENRVEVPLRSVAPVLQQAVVAIEDSRFFQHGGIDPRGVARAAVNDTAGGKVQGASTLTQQYIKNVLVEQAVGAGDDVAARAAVARTTARKVREMKLAIALENQVGKEEILQRYLNIAFFGGHTYGVEAASQRWFGVPAARLSLPQAATLAGMIQEPATYDPLAHPAAARQRRDVVLARMVDQGMITPAQRAAASAGPVVAKGRPPARGCTSAKVDGFFCDFVLQSLLKDTKYSTLGRTTEQRLDAITRGGLVIRTTLDAKTQYAADQAVTGHVPPRDSSGLGAAAVTVEPGTGKVLGMAQNRTYSVTSGKGLTAVNYGTDNALGGSSGFQTGSSFKPFTLAAWLAAGNSLKDKVDATKRPFPYRSFTACGRHLRGTKPYTPGNSEGRETGKMTVSEATFNSVNVAYVDMESQVDLCSIAQIAGRLGVHLATPEHECRPGSAPSTTLPTCLPSLTLGVKDIAPLTMAAAYAGFASGGTYCSPWVVTSLERGPLTATRTKIASFGPQCRRAIDRRIAHGVTDALKLVLTKGTAAGTGPLRPWPSAGKTGTTDGPYDSWFVGYTAQRSTAVWVADPGTPGGGGQVGRRQLTGITVDGSYHQIVYGATVAAPIWKSLMEGSMRGLAARSLP